MIWLYMYELNPKVYQFKFILLIIQGKKSRVFIFVYLKTITTKKREEIKTNNYINKYYNHKNISKI